MEPEPPEIPMRTRERWTPSPNDKGGYVYGQASEWRKGWALFNTSGESEGSCGDSLFLGFR